MDSNGNQWQLFDLLGSDLHYCRDRSSFSINMSKYITKNLEQRFKIECNKPTTSPSFDESGLIAENAKELPDYPAREVVGRLQWVSSVCRPDITVPVSTLAKYVSKTTTVAFAKACRKVMKYLISTKNEGISYSPAGEIEFNNIYGSLLPPGKSLPDINIFSDAGFANCLTTLRSTSGSICYFRSVPIFWRSAKQGVRAYSSAESEFIACSDAIVISEHNSYLDFFKSIPSKSVDSSEYTGLDDTDLILWVDNTSAISTSKDKDFKPRSRHYALRHLRVRDFGDRIYYCPTTLMKADALTKLVLSQNQRRLLLHHIRPVSNDALEDAEYEDDCYYSALLVRY